MLREVRIEGFGGLEGGVVVLDHLLEGGKASIVHVGRGKGDVPEGRGTEFVAVGLFARGCFEAEVIRRRKAVVVK